MKNILRIAALALVVFFSACDDFGDMNENPNAPSAISNNPELLLTGIQKDIVNRMVNDSWGEGNLMAQYVAKIVFTAFDQFEWGTNGGTWNTIYRSSREVQNLLAIAEETGNDSYKAVGLVMRAWMFQILTDMWGDVPYSEALKGKTEDIFTPAYDKQQDIYVGILADLKEANNLLASSTASVKGDIILDGDLDKWRKLANSLKLRVLMRLTEVDGGSINLVSELKSVIENQSSNPLIIDNADNAVMTYTSSFPNVHPKSEASGHRIGSFDEYRMSETYELVLEAYNDPRQMALFAPTEVSITAGSPDYSGMINGMVDGSAYEYKGGPSNVSNVNPQKFYYSPNAAQALIMQASEVHFLIAEAAVRYSEIAAIADAQTYYEEGIALNFEYWGVDLPADYLTRTSSDAAYSVPVAFDGTVETVITQKWIALFYTDYQGFFDYKRTGFPTVIQPGPDAQRDVYPSRFEYPGDEQSLNKENYDNAIANQTSGEYSFWTPVWWENK